MRAKTILEKLNRQSQSQASVWISETVDIESDRRCRTELDPNHIVQQYFRPLSAWCASKICNNAESDPEGFANDVLFDGLEYIYNHLQMDWNERHIARLIWKIASTKRFGVLRCYYRRLRNRRCICSSEAEVDLESYPAGSSTSVELEDVSATLMQTLTYRQQSIFALLLQSYSSSELAGILNISTSTAKREIRQIRAIAIPFFCDAHRGVKSAHNAATEKGRTALSLLLQKAVTIFEK